MKRLTSWVNLNFMGLGKRMARTISPLAVRKPVRTTKAVTFWSAKLRDWMTEVPQKRTLLEEAFKSNGGEAPSAPQDATNGIFVTGTLSPTNQKGTT